MLKIAVFVSGRGSNLKALLERFSNSQNFVKISAVVSNKLDCPAIELASEYDIPFYFVSNVEKVNFKTFADLKEIFFDSGINFIVLAGFVKMIPSEFVDAFENKIINIHPALLPSFGGKGMYGMNVHNAVFESSVKVSGATVHFVNSRYDEGRIICQRCVDISDVESPEEIARRVLKIEHQLLPDVVELFAKNKIIIDKSRVKIKDD